MAKYDPGIIYEHADALYRQARWIKWRYAAPPAVVGILGVAATWRVLNPPWLWEAVLVVAALATWVAYNIGRGRAFSLMLQAQTALCQAKIEENTRREMRAP